ncbi:DUF5011 domain-containing protein, partial [bacterium]|nr:DUF5011 domain-containing protein [bacterium]
MPTPAQTVSPTPAPTNTTKFFAVIRYTLSFTQIELMHPEMEMLLRTAIAKMTGIPAEAVKLTRQDHARVGRRLGADLDAMLSAVESEVNHLQSSIRKPQYATPHQPNDALISSAEGAQSCLATCPGAVENLNMHGIMWCQVVNSLMFTHHDHDCLSKCTSAQQGYVDALSDACEAVAPTEFEVEITVQPMQGETEVELHERALAKFEATLRNPLYCSELGTKLTSLAEMMGVQLPTWTVHEFSTGCFVAVSPHEEPISIVTSTDYLPGHIVDFVSFNVSIADETIESVESNIFVYQQAIAHIAHVYVGQVKVTIASARTSRRLLAGEVQGVVLAVLIEVESSNDAESVKGTVQKDNFQSDLVTHLHGDGIEVPNLEIVQSTVKHTRAYRTYTGLVNRPIINIAGDDVVVLEATTYGHYSDAGATCFDPAQGHLSHRIQVIGTLYPSISNLGTYSIGYMCTNVYGFSAEMAVRHVVVRDTECPVCTLKDGPTEFEASFPYADAGAHCIDSLDGPIQDVVVVNDVDVERVGTYKVTYRAQDTAGNWNDGSCKGSTQSIRTVRVIDTLQPVLSLHYKDKHLLSSSGGITGANGEENPASHRSLLVSAPSFNGWTAAAALVAGVGAVFGAFSQRR